MARYSGDPYVDPISGVLKNRLGITDASLLEQVEADLVAARSYELSRSPLKGKFDLAHLQAIHHYLFRDVYEWAGKLRTVDISKGSTRFAHHAHIVRAAAVLFQELAEEKHLAGLDMDAFSERGAYYLGELNALHPFREGNGRTQRTFLDHLARRNRYEIVWKDVQREELLQASVESFRGNRTRLARARYRLARSVMSSTGRSPPRSAGFGTTA